MVLQVFLKLWLFFREDSIENKSADGSHIVVFGCDFFYGLNWKYLTGMLLISKLSINFNTKGYVCRHVGDLGNIIAGEDKGVITYMTDSKVKLSGDHSVLGRAVVVSTCIIVIIITSTRHSCQYYVITI